MTTPITRWWQEGTGPLLVFVHGYAAHSAFWDPWMPELTRRYTCLRVDLPGFGQAPTPPGCDYSPHALAGALVDTLLHLDVESPTLVGHSLGGGVALLATLMLMDRGGAPQVRRMVSVAGAAYPQRPPPFVRMARYPALFRTGLAAAPKRWLVRAAMRAMVVNRDVLTPERVEGYAAPMRESARRHAMVECARQIFPRDLDQITARIPTIRVPTLCLWGDHDPVVPLAVGQRLARELPRGRLAVVPRCGHQVVEERPRESLRILLDFLQETEGGEADEGGEAEGGGAGA